MYSVKDSTSSLIWSCDHAVSSFRCRLHSFRNSMAAATFRVTTQTHKAARTQKGHENTPALFLATALLGRLAFSLLILFLISRIAIDSVSSWRLLPVSMDSALTQGTRSLPATLLITRILRRSNTKESTQIARKN